MSEHPADYRSGCDSPRNVEGILALQNAFQVESLQRRPGLQEILSSEVCVFSSPWGANAKTMIESLVTILVTLILVIALALGMLASAIITLRRRKSLMSVRTYNMHRQFIVTLILQVKDITAFWHHFESV